MSGLDEAATRRPTKSVLIVEDYPLVREGLAALLRQAEGYALCGEAGNAASALELVREHSPDVICLDLPQVAIDAPFSRCCQHPLAQVYPIDRGETQSGKRLARKARTTAEIEDRGCVGRQVRSQCRGAPGWRCISCAHDVVVVAVRPVVVEHPHGLGALGAIDLVEELIRHGREPKRPRAQRPARPLRLR